eukprot:NODE_2503_length_1184_cov_35.702203_g2285_i0.p2 GENE.NODE_2503_length_1184_cov_35.702203_g2285_i0~~NODE_2503_length_1184_cov_35.702203_g2285_i0.p2  ORF type:complete len:117 (+),score=5.15 NODE_2503_length_1184_cov_35.702203_g2285_i0:165-515(+)
MFCSRCHPDTRYLSAVFCEATSGPKLVGALRRASPNTEMVCWRLHGEGQHYAPLLREHAFARDPGFCHGQCPRCLEYGSKWAETFPTQSPHRGISLQKSPADGMGTATSPWCALRQ